MSQRLMKKIEQLAKERHKSPLVVTMRSGREIRGELTEIDWPNAVVTLKVSHQEQAHLEKWHTMINMDLIESVMPAWSIAV